METNKLISKGAVSNLSGKLPSGIKSVSETGEVESNSQTLLGIWILKKLHLKPRNKFDLVQIDHASLK